MSDSIYEYIYTSKYIYIPGTSLTVWARFLAPELLDCGFEGCAPGCQQSCFCDDFWGTDRII